jgi:hypothetical protein
MRLGEGCAELFSQLDATTRVSQELYSAPSPELSGISVRVDAPPNASARSLMPSRHDHLH